MEELVNLITNNSMTVVVIAYFLWRDYKFNSTLNEKLTQLLDTMNVISMILKDLDGVKEVDTDD